MGRHIIDRNGPAVDAPLLRYVRAARATSDSWEARRWRAVQRRARGPFNPATRLRAYLRIARGHIA